jgi:molybdate transport system substrate-binding protein
MNRHKEAIRMYPILRTSLVLLLLAVTNTACGPTSPHPEGRATAGRGADSEPERITLNVFAAASLRDAFEEIGEQFSAKHRSAEVVFNFAGSNQLATQIGEGAPADVFASANRAQMQTAIDSRRIDRRTAQAFARNKLVVVTPSDNPRGLAALEDLATPGVKIVFAAQEVPVGQYALDFLNKAEESGSLGEGYRQAVFANVVSFEENARSVLAKVALGEADAGIVYTSDAAAAGEGVQQIGIPDELNTVAEYPIAVLNDSPSAGWAQEFVEYVLSPEGQQVLERYGFVGKEGE